MIRLAVGSWPLYIDGIPFTLILAVVMSGIFPAIGHTPILRSMVWVIAEAAWSAAGIMLWRSYMKSPDGHSAHAWSRRLIALWSVHGVIWALIIPVFWDVHNAVNQALICVNVLAVMVGGFYTLSPWRPAFLANLASMILTSWASFALVGGALATALSFIFPLFAGLIVSYGWQLSTKYRNAIELGFRNEDLVHALSEAKSAAEDASRAKSLFLANMSHELRTPLNAIIGFSEIIRDRVLGDRAIDKYSDYAADVVNSGSHLLVLINRILDLAKVEAGKMTFEPTEFPISGLIVECARIAEIKAREKGLALVVEDRCKDVVVRADETAIRQILLNLVSNAVKFTDDGYVKIRGRAEGACLCVDVIDSGRGIGKSDIGRIFAPFERADNSLAAAHGGTGLGLAMVKRLAELHGGSCNVTDAPDRGTVFTLLLPIVVVPEAAAA